MYLFHKYLKTTFYWYYIFITWAEISEISSSLISASASTPNPMSDEHWLQVKAIYLGTFKNPSYIFFLFTLMLCLYTNVATYYQMVRCSYPEERVRSSVDNKCAKLYRSLGLFLIVHWSCLRKSSHSIVGEEEQLQPPFKCTNGDVNIVHINSLSEQLSLRYFVLFQILTLTSLHHKLLKNNLTSTSYEFSHQICLLHQKKISTKR